MPLAQLDATFAALADPTRRAILAQLARGLATCSYRLVDMRVAQVMNRALVTCSPDDDVDVAMALMTHRRTRHIPVVADGRLFGIVSLGDMVKSKLDEMELENKVLRDLHLAHFGS